MYRGFRRRASRRCLWRGEPRAASGGPSHFLYILRRTAGGIQVINFFWGDRVSRPRFVIV